jgi:hypothetical protein
MSLEYEDRDLRILGALACVAARQFGFIFEQQVPMVESLEVLRARAKGHSANQGHFPGPGDHCSADSRDLSVGSGDEEEDVAERFALGY